MATALVQVRVTAGGAAGAVVEGPGSGPSPTPNLDRMDLLVVRHGHAWAKERWRGDDRLRPLSGRGRTEALALVARLAPFGPGRIVSSPLSRCVQTVEPLAAHLGLVIEESDALGPTADKESARLLRALATGPRPVVVCTHGETIAALQRRLARAGGGFGPGGAHEKGSVWLLRGTGGRFTSATYLPPPPAREPLEEPSRLWRRSRT